MTNSRKPDRLESQARLTGKLPRGAQPVSIYQVARAGEEQKRELSRLRAEMQKAWYELDEGRCAESLTRLTEVVSELQPFVGAEAPTVPGEEQPSVLMASARALQGRAYQATGQTEKARTAFGEAVQWFEQSALGASGQDYAEYGVALHQVGRYEDAVAQLQKAVELQETGAETFFCMGSALYALERYPQAEQALRRAVEKAPQRSEILAALAWTLERMERYDEALETYRQAASTAAEMGSFEEAVDCFERILTLHPDDKDALTGLGDALRILGRSKDALVPLQRARELDPESALAWALLGAVYYDLNQYADALDAFERALAQKPEFAAWLLSQKGSTLRLMERFDEAIAVLDKALELTPGEPWTLMEKGVALSFLEREEEALAALDQALQQVPDNPFALAHMGRVLRALGRPQEAVAPLRQATEAGALPGWVYTELGGALYDLEQYPQALEAFDKALELDASDAMALAQKGSTLRLMERFDEAVGVLDKALQEAPDEPWTLIEKSLAVWMLGQNDEALITLERAEKHSPHNPFLLRWKAVMCRDAGKYGRALEAIEEALSLAPDDPDLLAVHASLLCDTGEYQAAVEAVNRIEEPGWNALLMKGWGLEYMGAKYADEASQVYSAALSQQPPYPDRLWVLTGLADALRVGGYPDRARQTYEQAIKEASERSEEIGTDAFAQLGWCHCQLGHYDEALRLLNVAVAAQPRDFPSQFDLGLTLACSRRYDLAHKQYTAALQEMAQHEEVLRQHGLLHVALDDLQTALDAQPALRDVPQIQQCLRLLQDAHAKVARRT